VTKTQNPADQSPGALARYWGPLVQVSLWITSIVGVFLAAPARISLAPAAGTDSGLFAQFLVAVLSSAMFVAFAKYGGSRYLRLWTTTLIASVLLIAVLYFSYANLQDQWTCSYATKWQLVKGDTYTAATNAWIAAHYPGIVSCERLLEDSEVSSENVWVKGEVIQRHLVLDILFTVLWLGCATAIMSAAHLLSYIPNRRKRLSG
jgi:energy-coupling factor transporter transmembrane protein EcfT